MNLKNYTLSILICTLGISFSVSAQVTVETIDFEVFDLPLDRGITASATNTDSSFFFNDLEFPSMFNPSYGGFWSGGWALSTSRNDSIKDFTNLIGSASGSGIGMSDTYLAGQNGAYILLPENTSVVLGGYSNLAYTAEVLLNGSSFSRPFGTDSTGMDVGFPDSLVLVLNYYLEDVLVFSDDNARLADFTSTPQNDFILTEWESFVFSDIPTFIEADSVVFNLVSSQSGMFGNNTPDFFVIDDLIVLTRQASSVSEISITEAKLYPNPTSSIAQLSDVSIQGDLQIFDNLGRLVSTQNDHQAGYPIDLSSFPSGVYHVFLRGDSEVVRGTLIKD
jgi:hypothetical protein